MAEFAEQLHLAYTTTTTGAVSTAQCAVAQQRKLVVSLSSVPIPTNESVRAALASQPPGSARSLSVTPSLLLRATLPVLAASQPTLHATLCFSTPTHCTMPSAVRCGLSAA